MAEKCTNTSSPVERWINPYPFAPLNHFTVPFSLTAETPFTNSRRMNSPSPRISPRFSGAPSKNPDEFFICAGPAEEERKLVLKTGKAPQPTTAETHCGGELQEPDNLALSTTRINVNRTRWPHYRAHSPVLSPRS